MRAASIHSYRDAIRLFLGFLAAKGRRRITALTLSDLTFDRVCEFLRFLEEQRGNQVSTRNHRRAVLVAFFTFIATRVPEFLHEAERVAAIPTKRTPQPETGYLTRDQVSGLLEGLPVHGAHAERDRTLLLFLYNTGARVQEAADLRIRDIDLGEHRRVRLHGKGDKWRVCPLWQETVRRLEALIDHLETHDIPGHPVFVSRAGCALTRHGIYKIVRRHAESLERSLPAGRCPRITPHVLRHSTAVHLLESGVEMNVIRSWLGHVSLETTNRYAEISMRAKEAAVNACDPPVLSSEGFPRTPVWRNEKTLLAWLDSL